MYRRRRYSRRYSSKYSWTKELRSISQTGTGQVGTLLYEALVPSLVKNIRVDNVGTNVVAHLVVVVKSGESLNSINFTDGSPFYEPESNVMLWTLSSGTDPYQTKTARKLNPGDKLYYVTFVSGEATRQALCQFYVGS